MTQIHKSHQGELQLQQRRNTPKDLIAAIPQYISHEMPQQHAEFFAGLSYLPLATLDNRGRPWVSLLVTTSQTDPSIGIQVLDPNTTDIVAETSPFDPFTRALQQDHVAGDKERLFAGVGVDFSNRRRNKLAGSIGAVSVETQGKISLQLESNQHLGNCPKYITVRMLAHERRIPELAFDSFDTNTSGLPNDAKTVIDRASTVFLATKHTAADDSSNAQTDMGMNHRGGAPGFTRLYEETDGDKVTTYLVLPDHSGNRFYQSLGNIETDPQVGLVFPDFATGDLLHVTGEAENLLDDKADALIPRVTLLTRIKVTGAVFVKQGLNLKLTSQEQLSPYNPPVKLLRQELEQMGRATVAQNSADAITATLVSTQALSGSITTFNFELSSQIETPLPGGFGVFDFSGLMDAGYSHMNEANPQLVNEDYVRTWTLSRAAEYDKQNAAFHATNRVSVTVKRKPGGLMSNVLHDNADKLITDKLPVAFKGTGAGFSCFSPAIKGSAPILAPKMLWIAGGVGITPFMAMWDGIVEAAHAHPKQLSTDIVLLYSARDDDIAVLKHFAASRGSLPAQVKLRIVGFQSVGRNPPIGNHANDSLRQSFPEGLLKLEDRRVQLNDVQSVADLCNRDVFSCGPEPLMNWSDTTLTKLGVEDVRRHRESFIF